MSRFDMINRIRHNLKCISSSNKSLLTILLHKYEGKCSVTSTFVEVTPFKLHKLDAGPSTSASITKESAMHYFATMTLIRRIELILSSLYKEKIIRGFCHLYNGQEACCVGIKAALRPNDPVITAYRDHGWGYVMGIDPHSMIAELAGKKSGCGRGKGGSMHIYTETFFGGNGIVGGQVPLGTGIAFAAKYLNTGAVCVTVYGDGAANQGQVFEVYNMAKLWNLPVIFVCENNGFGMGTRTNRASASTKFYTRGDYVPGIWVDGMDVLAVREATAFAIQYCLAQNGPIILEVETYRYSGHSLSDPGKSYRSREEVQKVKKMSDPINSFKQKILKINLVTEEEFRKTESDIAKELNEIARKVTEESEVAPEELTADIYENCLEKRIRGVLPWNKHYHKRIGTTFKKIF